MSLLAAEMQGEGTFLLAFALGVAAHEAGHAIGAKLAGLQPRQVAIGQGPAIFRTQVAGALLVLRLLPLSGYVLILPQPAMSRRAYAVMVASGPAANALLLACVALAAALRPDLDDALLPAGLAQAMILLVTLAPYRWGRGGQRRSSDGMQLWTYAVRRPPDPFAASYAAMQAAVLPAGAERPPPSPAAPELIYQMTRRDRLRDAWAARDASAAMLGLLRTGALRLAERIMALDFLAGNEVLFGGTGATLADLDAWSEEAVALSPCPGPHMTRASVLTRLGRPAEAEAMLRPLLDSARGPGEAALCRLHLAEAAAALSQREQAGNWLAQARAAAAGPHRRLLLDLIGRAERRRPLAPVDPAGDAAISAP